VIGVTPAPTTALTFRDLGAVPSSYTPGQLPPWRFAGAALDLAGLAEGGHYAVYGRSSLTANVVFWPRVYTIVGNRTVLDELTDDQRDVLRTAAREAVAPAIARLQAEDRAEATALCGRDRVRFVQATPSQVSALQAAVRPLYASIERDQATRSVVATIATLKRGTTPERPLQCVAAAAPEEAATPLDGTWEMTAPRAEADEVDAGRYRLLLRQGRVVLYHLSPPKWGGPPGGVFTVRGNTVRFRFPDGDTGRYRWNVYRDTLTLRAVPGVSSAPNPTFAPWHRVS
jgi:hypothetical protein